MDNLMLRGDTVESCTILKDKENSRFLLKSGIFFIFQDGTRFDGIMAEHQIVHSVPSVSSSSVWYSIKRASRRRGRWRCWFVFCSGLFFAYGSVIFEHISIGFCQSRATVDAAGRLLQPHRITEPIIACVWQENLVKF